MSEQQCRRRLGQLTLATALVLELHVAWAVGPVVGQAVGQESTTRLRHALQQDPTSSELVDRIRQAIEVAGSRADQAAQAELLLALGRAHLEVGDTPRARAEFERLDGLFPAAGPEPPLAAPRQLEEPQESPHTRYRYRVAFEYLRANLLDEGLGILASVLDGGASVAGSPERSAVAGQLHRRLDQLAAGERYEILRRWVLPDLSETAAPRLFCATCSLEAPPPVFARVLADRPSSNAFPTVEVAGYQGLFSIGWELVSLAQQQGRLSQLIAELEARQAAVVRAEQAAAGTADAVAAADGAPTQARQPSPATRAIDFLVLLARIVADDAEPPHTLAAASWLPAPPADLRRLVMATQDGPAVAIGRRDPQGVYHIVQGRQLLDDVNRALVLVAASGRDGRFAAAADALLNTLQRYHELGLLSSRRLLQLRYRRLVRREAARLASPGLRHWSGAAATPSSESARDAGAGLWIEHDQHLFAAGSQGHDLLLFRYPLRGDFEVEVETQAVGYSHTRMPGNGTLAYGGAEGGVTWNQFRLRDPLLSSLVTMVPCSFARTEEEPVFHRLALRVRGNAASFLVNGHPLHTFESSSAFPWLSLGAAGDDPIAFRRLVIRGTPDIPRSVPLTADSRLRGWSAVRYNRSRTGVTQPQPAAPAPNAVESFFQSILGTRSRVTTDWQLADGVLTGHRSDAGQGGTSESLLRYLRPLFPGESVTYEFYYQPDQQLVHPALGRLALLIDPGGVRLHWLTDAAGEWSGLDAWNQVSDLSSRRGPRPLPLKAAAWNQAELARADGKLSLKLNGELVYEHRLPDQPEACFGLFHDQLVHEARVRNVMLTGDWPSTLPAELLASSTAEDLTHTRAVASILGDATLSQDALHVVRHTRTLPESQRYSELSRWVLPCERHPLRMAGAFTPTHPPEGLEVGDRVDEQRRAAARDKGRSRVELGGNLVAPGLDLVDVASAMGRLDEVERIVEAAPQATDLERRARLTMLLLVAVAREDAAAAERHLKTLYPLVVLDQPPPGVEGELRRRLDHRWPDLLATRAALQVPSLRASAEAIAQHLYVQQVRSWKWTAGDAFDQHVISLVGLARHLNASGKSAADYHVPPELTQWDVVGDYDASTRGQGVPRAHWERAGSEIRKLSTHLDDAVYFDRPLRGNFAVEYRMPVFNWQETQVTVAGGWAALRYNLKGIRHGGIRGRSAVYGTIEPPFPRPKDFIHMRAVVQGNVRTTYCNGRLLHQTTLPQDYDPWLSFKSRRDNRGAIFEIAITGEPEVPAEINLLPEGVAGWQPYYDDQLLEPSGRDATLSWQLVGDEFHGMRIGNGQQGHESLIHYHRPMLEDGEIRYQFFYRPGQSVVHPALDRVAFLLEPEGVVEHLVTDGRYDRLGLDPLNREIRADCRRSTHLPFKLDAWNQLSLRLTGDVLTLVLNDVAVYERAIGMTNQRRFGLFYYAEQSQPRVKEMVWRGGWPTAVPPLAGQELANPVTRELEAWAEGLPASWDYQFGGSHFPVASFDYVGNSGTFEPLPAGLLARRASEGAYHQRTLVPRLVLSGDFDITARFEGLRMESQSDGNAGAAMLVRVDHAYPTQLAIRRGQSTRDASVNPRVQTTIRHELPAGPRQSWPNEAITDASAGRLRIARRGKTFYTLFAENDSDVFQLISTDELPGGDVDATFWLVALHMAKGETSVVWKDLRVRAQRIARQDTDAPDSLREQLDAQRQQLAANWGTTFKLPLDARRWKWDERIGPPPQPVPGGVRITSTGGYTPLSPRVVLVGDFDLTVQYAGCQLARPPEGRASSHTVQVAWPDGDIVDAIVGRGAHEYYFTVTEGGPNKPDRKFYARVPIDAPPRRVRLVRRGATLHALIGYDDEPDRLVTRVQVPTTPVLATRLQLMVHSGHASERSSVDVMAMQLRGKELQQVPEE